METVEKALSMVQQAIEIERYGYGFYNAMRPYVADRRGQKVLSYLARLEVEHMEMLEDEFEGLLSEYEVHPDPDVSVLLEGKELIFLTDDKLPKMFKRFDPVRALTYALGLEKRSMQFYKQKMGVARRLAIREPDLSADMDELSLTFEKLARFELDHVKLIQSNLKALKRGKWAELR